MPIEIKQIALAEYEDGSEGTLTIYKLTPLSGDPFMVISDDSSCITVGTADQAKQLISAIHSLSREIWEE